MTKRNDHLVLEAVRHARREACEIVLLCGLASRPEMAAQMILAGTSVDAARRTLERLLADQPVKRTAGNGSSFDLGAIEAALAEKRPMQ